MSKFSQLLKNITGKHGSVIDLNENPGILMDIITDLRIHESQGGEGYMAKNPAPFNISWMDSWAANWMLHQQTIHSANTQENDFRQVIQQLTDLKFNERIQEISKFIKGFVNESPDGGTPEPGVPPVGPANFFDDDPEPPDGGTPEPGVPLPPAPTGPDAGILRENPWILYWFVSINASFILEMIDAHFTRRMNDLRQTI
jgi:hypothetical protein